VKIKLFDEKECREAVNHIFNMKNSGDLKHENEHRFSTLNKNSYGCYSDPVFNSLALKALPQMEESCGLKLYPTYTYTRLYLPGYALVPHLDRPACEFSSTVTIGYGDRESPWEIYIENDDLDGVEYILYPGEGVIYEGRKYHHWRLPLDKGWQIQTFVHYIEIEGEVYYDVLERDPNFDFSEPFHDFKYDPSKKYLMT
jgi:hypothetical protein